MVAEETPLPPSRRNSSVIPESPENPGENPDSTNISGTTFLGHRDDATSDEEDSESLVLTAEDIVDDLPDLKPAAIMLMSLLVSDHDDERGIVNEARRLRTADRAEKRRIEKHSAKLVDRMSNFTNQIFIDVNHVRNLVPVLTSEDSSQQWSPAPTLYSANCARLAHSLLLSTGETQFDRKVIKTLNFQFPAPFLDQLSSGTEKATFDLALDIRTQHFVMEFDRQQGQKDFDPKTLVQSIFYDASQHEGTELDSRWLRGFSLQSVFLDENMCLPERFHNDVLERIDDITDAMIDDDDTPSITDLKAAFPWKRFYRRAAHFLRRRDIEISQDLKMEVDMGDVRRVLRRQLGSEHGTPSRGTPSVLGSLSVQSKHQTGSNFLINRAERMTQTPSAQPTPTRQPSAMNASTRPSATQKAPAPEKTTAVPPAPSPAPAPAPAPIPKKAPLVQPAQSTLNQASSSKDPKKKMQGFRDLKSLQRVRQRQQQLGLGQVEEPPTTRRETPAGSFGDETLVNDDDGDFGVSHDGGEDITLADFEESTTPPGSARTTQVSHTFGAASTSPVRRNQPTSSRTQSRQTPHRFTDRQNNAARVSPINEAESQSIERQTAPRPHTNKRTRDDMDSDDSDGFEQDTRDANREARRARLDQDRRVRQRTEQSPDDEDDDDDDDDDAINDQLRAGLEESSQPAPSQPGRRRTPPARATSSVPPSSTAPEAPRRVTIQEPQASRASVLATTAPPSTEPVSSWRARNSPGVSSERPPQAKKRGTWSVEEDERLVKLLTVHGKHWAHILAQDRLCPPADGGPRFVEKNRSQVDIKDRARVLRHHWERYVYTFIVVLIIILIMFQGIILVKTPLHTLRAFPCLLGCRKNLNLGQRSVQDNRRRGIQQRSHRGSRYRHPTKTNEMECTSLQGRRALRLNYYLSFVFSRERPVATDTGRLPLQRLSYSC